MLRYVGNIVQIRRIRINSKKLKRYEWRRTVQAVEDRLRRRLMEKGISKGEIDEFIKYFF